MENALGRRALQLAVVVGATSGFALAGAGASGSNARQFHVLPLKRAFAVLRTAHIAQAAPALAEPLTGSTSTVFATSNSDSSQLFVSTQADGDICLIDQEPVGTPTGASGSVRNGMINVGCSSAADAEEQGGVLISPATSTLPAVAAVLVPDGVTSVNFDLANDTTVTEPVVNNVSWYSSPQLKAVQYNIAGAGTVTTGTTS